MNIELMAIAAGATATTSTTTATRTGATRGVDGKVHHLRSLCARILASSDPVVAYCSLTHAVAWGLPAVQTVIVVMAQLVDADELLGEYSAIALRTSYLHENVGGGA